MLICGGWNKQAQSASYIVNQESAHKYKFLAKGEPGTVGNLEKEDSFSYNGAIRHVTEKDEFILCGQEYLHVYNDKEKTFKVLRKLDYA